MKQKTQKAEPGKSLPAGVPTSGNYAFLLKLGAASSGSAYNGARSKGAAAARAAAKTQLTAITTAQNKTVAALPSKSRVLYRTHAVLSGLAVVTDVKNFSKLQGISGVTAVYPIAPKSLSNSFAVPFQHAPEAWQAFGDLGANSSVAIIDTGVDYTHANFGGVGTVADFDAATAQLGKPVSPNEFPGPKVVGGFDLVGDDYNADPNDPAFNPVPAPDPFPLDCNGHGSHVAGTVGGLGENADGSTYTGPYDTTTPFSTLRIGPGMAPAAKLYAFRVFGCAGSTDVVSDAIDMAADPDGNGDTSDHVNVINMSLGSDFGSPQDGDSVTTNAAAALGINMAVAMGNGGDLYDVGGSPGNATRTIAAAASADAYSQVDALNVTAPAAARYAAERSIAYDYVTKPDLGSVVPGDGNVVRVTDPANLDGCDPLSAADAAAVAGHIAFVEWTDVDANRRCGSVQRSGNLAAAGAVGFIFADDEESFAAGITGSAVIPGVLAAKSGGDAIRAQLLANTTVTIGSTTLNGFAQMIPALNDTLAGFSSRGIGDAGNVKPDVTAVGVSVFSTGSGTGNEGLNDSGTSMATPMVAGTAALVNSQHPDWSTEQVKADIMNTADADLFTGPNHTGVMFAPERVGAGRIDVKAALDNKVLAYNGQDPGAVSVSFGPQAVSAPTVLKKTIKVQNTALAPSATYAVAYVARTSVPGAVYSVSPATVTLGLRSTATVTVTLTLTPSLLTKTIDPTVDRVQAGLPREYQADASGLVTLTGAGVPSLRVPVYSAPRPASVMTQPASLTLPAGAVQQAVLPLSGHAVNQGTGDTAVRSIVAGFELQAKSGLAPTCSVTVTSGCVHFSDERSADLKYVAATTDGPQETSLGNNPLTDGEVYFSITTQGPWRTAASDNEFDILIDTDGDNVPDVVLFNTRLSAASDTMIDELVDLATGDVLDAEFINDRAGDTDTALLQSDTMVLPVLKSALPGITAANPRIHYGVASFSNESGPPVDSVGVDNATGNLSHPLTIDVRRPAIAVFGSLSLDPTASLILFRDLPGSVLQVRREAVAFGNDRPLGALIVHFHNGLGTKAQVMALKSASQVSLKLSPTRAARGAVVTATVKVTNTAGVAATGRVSLRRVGGAVVTSGVLVNGAVTLRFTQPTRGTFAFRAEYAGDANYLAGNSGNAALTII